MRITFLLTIALIFSGQTGVSDDTPSAKSPAQLQGVRFSVAENSPAGTTVGTVSSRKATTKSRHAFSITGGDEQGVFAIHAKTGRITVKNSTRLDHETDREFHLQVSVEEAKAESVEDSFDSGFAAELRKSGIDIDDETQLIEIQSVTIIVDNVNEAPVVEEQTLSVAEHSGAGTVVGRMLASDPDTGDTMSYWFNNDNSKSPLSIDRATGEITVVDPVLLDFETESLLEINVVVLDTHGAVASETIRVELININEPPRLAAETFTLPEASAAGTVVGRVLGVDPDGDAALTYAITRGNDDHAFAINEQTGEIVVTTRSILDFEQSPQRIIVVEARDGQGEAAGVNIQIDLTDVNESPIVGEHAFVLSATIEPGMVIGTIVAHDPDQGDALMFSITGGNDDGAIAIDPRTGELTVALPEELHSRTSRRAALMVTVADQSAASTTAKATIDLGVAPADSSLAAVIRAMELEDENSGNNADPVGSQAIAATPKKATTPTKTTTPIKAAATVATAAPVATTGVVPATEKRSAAAWLIFCVGGGAIVWGGLLVFASLRQRRQSMLLRKSLAAAHQDEELLRGRLVELDVFSNELRAERDELMATRRLLTGEFDKLKTLLGRQTEELRSTDTALQHGDEILQRQLVVANSPPGAPSSLGNTLESVRREFAVQHQRLGSLQETMEQRDRELIDTCAKMDARLEELLRKTALIDVFDEQELGDVVVPPGDETNAADTVMAEWDKRQAQIRELEQQFDGNAGGFSPECHVTGVDNSEDTLVTSTALETDFGDDTVTAELQQKWAARTELNTLRDVANHSTRSVLAKYSRKKMLRSKMLLASLGLFGVCFAMLLLLGGMGTQASQVSLGWGALGTGCVAMVLLVASLFQHRKKS